MYTTKEIISMEVAPALGCTEPVAMALATAAAAHLIPGEVTAVHLSIDPNLYKNALAVAIPGTEGKYGLALAGALGAVLRNPEGKLEILSLVTPDVVSQAEQMVREKKVTVTLLAEKRGIYIHAVVTTTAGTAEATVEHYHNNITSLSRNGERIAKHPLLSEVRETSKSVAEMEKWLAGLSLAQLIALTDEMDAEDYAFIKKGVETNMALADFGLKHGPGLGIGLAHERIVRQQMAKRDMETDARILTSAASDARMSGVNLPAMSSAGSGNHGLTAILPVWVAGTYADVKEQDVLRAIALSHIVTAYVKAYTGRLSAVCGCSVAAGAGASAGIAYLMGGSEKHVAGAIKNVIQDLAGVICDGAKAGCALKLATAASSAVRSALLSLQGVVAQPSDGIIGTSAEDTMRNMGTLSSEGMIETDRTILNIMVKKQF